MTAQGPSADGNDAGLGASQASPQYTLEERLQEAPELRLIGRRIRLRLNAHGFEGLVTYICRTTVVLMDCERLTLQQAEARAQAAGDTAGHHGRQGHQASAQASPSSLRRRPRRHRSRQPPSQPSPAAREAPQLLPPSAAAEAAPSRNQTNRSPTPASGNRPVSPAAHPTRPLASNANAHPTMSDDGLDGDDNPSRESPGIAHELALQANTAEYPFCTFVRRTIRDVVLLDQRVPAKTAVAPPEHFLRAQIRRYVVQRVVGSAGNSSLRDYIARRTGWGDPSVELLDAMLNEETAVIDACAMEVSRERLARRQQQQQQQQQLGGGPRAPQEGAVPDDGGVIVGIPGLAPYERLGRLLARGDHEDEPLERLPFVLTGVSSRTMYVSIFTVVFAIITLLFAASVFATAPDAVVGPFVDGLSTWIIISAALWLLHASLTAVHVLQMEIPVALKITVARVLSYLACVSVTTFVTYITVVMCFELRNVLTNESLEELYRQQALTDQQTLCTYAAKEQCSGWSVPCNLASTDQTNCPSSCLAVLSGFDGQSTCDGPITASVRNIIGPLVAFQGLVCLALLVDLWLFYRFFRVAYNPLRALEGISDRRTREAAAEADAVASNAPVG